MTIAMVVAIVATGSFAGASLYVSVAEHPARVECGPALAVRAFGPTSRRAAVMQGGLAVSGFVAAVAAWGMGSGVGWLVSGLLLVAMVPYTLVVMKPTNRRLLDASLDTGSGEAIELLRR